MAEPGTTEGHAPGQDPYEDWLTRLQVTRVCGISIAEIRRRETSGELRWVKSKRGNQDVVLFDPGQFDKVNEPSADVSPAGLIASTAKLLRAMSKHSHKAHEQLRAAAKESMDLVLATCKATNETLSQLVKEQQHQVLELQKQSFENRKQVEDALTQKEEREIIRDDQRAKAALREKVYHDFRKFVPIAEAAVMKAIKEKTGVDVTPNAGQANGANGAAAASEPSTPVDSDINLNPWLGFFASATEEQGAKLSSSGLFPLEMISEVVRIRARLIETKGKDDDVLLDADRLLGRLTEEQRRALLDASTATQRIYLESIWQLPRQPPAEKATPTS